MSNPTPASLASTAMEAARELRKGNIKTRLEESETERDAAIIQKHFQPLLAKVEGYDELLKSVVIWNPGYPKHPYDKEWFLARTKFLDRVVLTALPEEFSYDFKTADDTYMKKENVVQWAQFPTSEYRTPLEDAEKTISALRADLAAKEAENRRLVVAFDPGALVERIRSHLVFQCGCTITGRIIEGMLVDIKRDLGKCVDSALASRADKGGAT